jgi:hypothetical protein
MQKKAKDVPNLRPISIRLQDDVIEYFKRQAERKGLKSQAYMRMILTEHKNSNPEFTEVLSEILARDDIKHAMELLK